MLRKDFKRPTLYTLQAGLKQTHILRPVVDVVKISILQIERATRHDVTLQLLVRKWVTKILGLYIYKYFNDFLSKMNDFNPEKLKQNYGSCLWFTS